MDIAVRGVWRGVGIAVGTAAMMYSGSVQALTITGLRGEGLESIYGDYAPGGNCAQEPRMTIGDAGFTFRAGAQTVHSKSIEYAVSYMGQSYDGISSVFFPFPKSEYEYGHVVMTVNADEKPGVVTFEANLAAGERLSATEAALVKASPFKLCAGTAKALPATAAPAMAASATATTPVQWDNLRVLADKQEYSYDMFDKGEVAAALLNLLGPKISVLKQNMNARSPIKRQGSLYYLSGNAPHRGGEDQAYILLDAKSKAVQVGLWERGKLTVYAPRNGRLPLPSEIAQLVGRSPPETATQTPGTPWELVPVDGRAPLAYVSVAGSPSIESFSVFCDSGKPTLAMLLSKPSTASTLNISWVFAGGIVNVPLGRSNSAGTFWQSYLTGSTLVDMLLHQSGTAYIRINGTMEGEASLANSSAMLKTALRSCRRF